ncbi:MAG: PGF-CTERM sorting domain-containing protein [Archaeoglobaceae archaeon]|nr:PGF-CTERM sorting domain-containing protein [Archaeoglobaceae archaeon]MDW8118592.1 S16 family serine protease [Archaeoglobaceae archaeon]
MRLAIMFLFMVSYLLTQPALAFEVQKTISAVAVTSGEDPEGVVINITVSLSHGSGRVFVSTTPFTEIDMQGSAQLSALTACDLLGIDFTKYNFFYIIEADAPIVGGPSAGAVMTIATISALKNLSLRDDVYMSGMIYPDGFIGPVGGLNYKLEAVAKNGGKIFLVPHGQRVVIVEEKVVRKVGMINIVTTNYKEVDLVEYGKQLGVDVYEVTTINDALKYFTGYEIKRKEISFVITEYSEILKILADKMREKVKELDKYATSDVNTILSRAENDYKAGNYYSATSKFFNAKILMRYELYKKTLLTTQQFDEEVEKISEEISNLRDYLKNEPIGVNSIQIIAAAQERVAEADNSLENALNSKSYSDALQNLAYAKERLESAKVWLSILPNFKEDYQLNATEIKKRAEFYINQANSVIVYASSLNAYPDLIESAYGSLEIAKKLYSDEQYAGAVFVALDAITEASLSIEAGYGNISLKLDERRENAKIALSEAEEVSYPVLPAAYFEFAETAENNYVKLMYYSLAERIAKFITIVAESSEEKELTHAEFSEIPTTQPKSAIRDLLKTPGFEGVLAICAMALIFLNARRKRNK